jgi:hypothetical protein
VAFDGKDFHAATVEGREHNPLHEKYFADGEVVWVCCG